MTNKQRHDEDLQDWRWHKFRGRIMYERDGHCERCSELRHKQLNVHHKFYDDRHLWEYNDDEVELVCRKCHKAEHGIKESKKIFQLNKYRTISQQYARWRTLDLVTLFIIQRESTVWKANTRRATGLWLDAKADNERLRRDYDLALDKWRLTLERLFAAWHFKNPQQAVTKFINRW